MATSCSSWSNPHFPTCSISWKLTAGEAHPHAYLNIFMEICFLELIYRWIKEDYGVPSLEAEPWLYFEVHKPRTCVSPVFQGAGSLFLEGGPGLSTSTTWGPSGESSVLRAWASPLCPQPGNCTSSACLGIPLNFQGFLKPSFNTALHFRSKGAAAVY